MCAINRREFLNRSTMSTLGMGLASNSLRAENLPVGGESASTTEGAGADRLLPGTAPLTLQGDLAAQMVEGIHRFLLRQTEDAARERPELWNRDYTSAKHYESSVAPHRDNLRKIIGAVDSRALVSAPELVGTLSTPALVAHGSGALAGF